VILKGAQRGGASQLANHLLNDGRTDDEKAKDPNDHVTVHELRGFVAGDLHGALAEIHAVSKGTRCSQFMFSLSLNPPKDAQIDVGTLVDAADRAEEVLGLTDQPRAVIIHEKNGRRHAHVVWSRIEAEEMKAVNLPHFKNKLNALSKELYLEHGWELPEGHRVNGWKNPLNFTLAEWQQAKRLDLDPREIKQVFQSAWQQSDNQKSFKAALEEHGYYLAQGDRRGFVAVDINGEVFAAARWAGVKTKDAREKLGSPENLPSVDETRAAIRDRMSQRLSGFIREERQRQREEFRPLAEDAKAMVTAHRAERVSLRKKQDERWRIETSDRSKRLATGLRGAWELLTGKAAAIRRQNEREAYQGYVRDSGQREGLVKAQSKDREELQGRIDALNARHREERMLLAERIADVLRRSDDAVHEHERATRQKAHALELEM
jgi:hypothetical protein